MYLAEKRHGKVLDAVDYSIKYGAAPAAIRDEKTLREYADHMGRERAAEQLLQAAKSDIPLNGSQWRFLEDHYEDRLDDLLDRPMNDKDIKFFHELLPPIRLTPKIDGEIGADTRLNAVDVPALPADVPSGPPPQTVQELLNRLRQECPELLKLVKAPPIRLVGHQRTGKSTFGRKLALLRTAFLPGHTIAWATPHLEADNPVPPILNPFGTRDSGAKDMAAIESVWGLTQQAIDRGRQLNMTAVWDEFGSYDQFSDKEALGPSLRSLLREASKHGYFPILVAHGDQASFYPGVTNILKTLQQSTIKVETIGEQADHFGAMRPTGEVEVTWLDDTVTRFKVPGWLTVDLLLKFQPENTRPALLDALQVAPTQLQTIPPEFERDRRAIGIRKEDAARILQEQGLLYQPHTTATGTGTGTGTAIAEPPSNVVSMPQNPIQLQFERVKQVAGENKDFHDQLLTCHPTLKQLLADGRKDLVILALFSMENGAVKARDVYNKAPSRRKLFHPLKVEGIRQLFEELESKSIGEVIGDDSEAFYRAFLRDDRTLSANSNSEDSDAL
jgi:hypothetical protein